MKKTQIKDIARNIGANAVSWLAVAIVVTITCGVYCGVFFYADALESTAANFFERTNFEDLTVTSANGVTEEEIRTLLSVPGVLDAEGTFQLSGAALRIGRQSHTANVLAVTERISVPELAEGRAPGEGMECALTVDAMERFNLSPGDEVSLELNGMPSLTLTVTGSVLHPDAYYLGESVYVFMPGSTLEALLGGSRFPVVLVDADCESKLLSDVYFENLSPIRSGVRNAMDDVNALREAAGTGEATGFAVTTRADRESFMVLRQIVDILRNLSTVFVVIFVVIGAIVVFSTITVIIDGQKRQIGFLKAYGFRDGEIVRRYLVYGESAVLVGMLCTVGVAFLLQLIIRNVLHGMFSLEAGLFTFRPGTYFALFLLETALTGAIAAVVTRLNASAHSAVELLQWSGKVPNHSRRRPAEADETDEPMRKGALYTRLIYRNIRSDWARVTASVIIIAGCCFMIGIGLTLNSAFHSMTKNTRREVLRYDLECTPRAGENVDELENAVQGNGASCARALKTQTIYGVGEHEEYVTVMAAGADVYQDYICLIDEDGGAAGVPETGCSLIQNRISERLGAEAGDELALLDRSLRVCPVRVGGTARNYLGRVMYLSEDTFTSIFGSNPAAETLLVRLDGIDRDTFAAMLKERFPDADISYTDSMPGMFSGLTDAFNALIYVMITLSVIMSVFVLLNLVNIFVSRRRNELIIMGVNGFSYREEIGYLLRETVATTVMGLIAGVLFGAAITETVVRIIEAPDTMCVRSVNWGAWAVGAATEAIFALLINLHAFRGVKRLSMGDLK